MAAVTAMYPSALARAAASGLVWTTADVRCMLLRDGVADFVAAHDFEDDLTSQEVFTAGYAQVLVPGAIISTSGNDRILTADSPIDFPGPFLGSVNIRAAAFKAHVGAASGNWLYGFHYFDPVVAIAVGEGLRLTIPATGIYLLEHVEA